MNSQHYTKWLKKIDHHSVDRNRGEPGLKKIDHHSVDQNRGEPA